MSVYRRDSKDGPRWVVDFVFKGERVNRTLDGVRTKREAVAGEARLRAEVLERSRAGAGLSVMSFGTAIERYARERLKPKSRCPANLNTYLGYLAMLREHFGADTPVTAIGKPEVASWWAATLSRPRITTAKPKPAKAPRKGAKVAPPAPPPPPRTIQPNTAKRYLTVLKAFLAFAKDAGAGNQVPTFSPTILDDSRVRWLNEEEEKALLEKAPAWMRDLVVFYLDTGARKSDALRLTWRHVHLPPEPARGQERFHDTKEDKPRSVPLSRRNRVMLECLKAERPKARQDDKVFLCPDGIEEGAMVPVGDFKKSWATARKAAGLEDVHVHDLRHTFASRLMMKRVPLFEVQKLMGHSSTKDDGPIRPLGSRGVRDGCFAAVQGLGESVRQ